MQRWREWETASKADWGLALQREAVARPLAEERRLNKDHLAQAMVQLGVGRSVL